MEKSFGGLVPAMKKILRSLPFLFTPVLLALAPGAAVPNLAARNQDGKMIRISDFKGKFVLLYFYPKDETPGCTKEACSFRDEYASIKKLNAVVLGVSRQDEKSHRKFIAQHKLPFDLLVDADGSFAKAFGVSTMPIVGFHKRQSVLIGPDGKVLHFYESVDPNKHVQEVIADIQKATSRGKASEAPSAAE